MWRSNNMTGIAKNTNNSSSNVCRDFLRNVCNRGSRCKFAHTHETSASSANDSNNSWYAAANDHFHSSSSSGHVYSMSNGRDASSANANGKKPYNLQDNVVFCHDFMNKGDCHRQHCKYLHCSREEEEDFLTSGYLPPHLKDQAVRKGIAADLPTSFGLKPICKDFLKGECTRSTCKFRHVSAKQYDLELTSCLNDKNSKTISNSKAGHIYTSFSSPTTSTSGLGGNLPSGANSSSSLGSKRKSATSEDSLQSSDSKKIRVMDSEIEMLRQENLLLSQRLEGLQKQVHSLTTTNEFLLNQNAQLRLRVKGSSSAEIQGAVPPGAVPSGAVATVVSMSMQPAVSMQSPSISIADAATIRMSGAPPNATMSIADQTIRMSGAPNATLTLADPSIRMSCAPPGSQPPPAPTANLAISTLEPAPVSVSVPVIEQAASVSLPVMSCCSHGQEMPPPAATGNAVHMQETRLVTFPITSLRQQPI